MRGSDKDKKLYYEWFQFEEDCVDLACVIMRSHNFSSVMGVRRGGIALAVRLACKLGIPITNRPTLNTLIVDDIVDSGATRDKYGMFRFASLFYKPWSIKKPNYYIHTTEDWIVFPWEVDYE
jgi:hypoxanthine phosphoribosyltransferase